MPPCSSAVIVSATIPGMELPQISVYLQIAIIPIRASRSAQMGAQQAAKRVRCALLDSASLGLVDDEGQSSVLALKMEASNSSIASSAQPLPSVRR